MLVTDFDFGVTLTGCVEQQNNREHHEVRSPGELPHGAENPRRLQACWRETWPIFVKKSIFRDFVGYDREKWKNAVFGQNLRFFM